jgi:hypothetical protein
MQVNTTQGTPEELQGQGWLGELVWLVAGTVLPLTSLSFYKRVVKRPPIMALIFIITFGLVVGLLTSFGVTRGLGSLESDVLQALEENEFPTITIESGIARADVSQPYTVYEDYEVAFIIDTTGQITQLERNGYDQGMLLTATELHVLNLDNDYNITDLDDLNLIFAQDPLVVNAETISDIAGGFASIFSVVAFVALLVWHFIVRVAWVCLLALIVWAIVGTFWQGVKYAEIWILGVYSSIPALYFTYLLSKINLSICGLQTFLLGLIMLFVAYAVRPPTEPVEAEPGHEFHIQYAWIGIPLLLVLAYDLVFRLPYQTEILWGTMLATMVTLAVLEYFVQPPGDDRTKSTQG